MNSKDFFAILDKNPSYLNEIKVNDLKDIEEIMIYAIYVGYNYELDIKDRFCENDTYVKTFIKYNENFIKYFMNSKHFKINRFEDNEEIRRIIINYALKNNMLDNSIILLWIENLKDSKKIFNEAGIYFFNKGNFKEVIKNNNIKRLYLLEDDIESINYIINETKKRNINIENINVKLSKKVYSSEELNRIIDKDFITFYSSTFKKVSIKDIEKMNKLLDVFVKYIRESNMSPYEKYIAVYNIVKSFKKYRFYNDDEVKDDIYILESRNVYLILNNLYIVCEGFSRLLETLLNRVGINNIYFGSKKLNHSFNYVNLFDEKYGIDGFYICDVTKDRTQENIMNQGYKHLHSTTTELKQKRNNEENIDDIFDANIETIIIYLSDLKKYNEFTNTISKLDPNFYNKIKNKKFDIELATEIYEYLKTKINKPINVITDIKAILEVKQFVYDRKFTEDEYKREWSNLINLDTTFLKELYDRIKYMKIIEIYNLKDVLTNENNKLLEDVLYKIEDEQLGKEDNTFFFLDLYQKSIKFQAKIEDELEEIKIKEIIENLINLGYKVRYNENTNFFEFLLDDISFNKTLITLYEEVILIKKDFIKLYKEVIPDLNFNQQQI